MGRHQVRIIGGRWRGSRIEFPPLAAVRPSPDRVRETLFNWLQRALPGAVCLDLFAGSGVLGLEALSRGASHAVFVDRELRIARHLRDTLARLKAASAEATVVRAEALDYLRATAAGGSPEAAARGAAGAATEAAAGAVTGAAIEAATRAVTEGFTLDAPEGATEGFTRAAAQAAIPVFDIVFLDPPFGQGLVSPTAETLLRHRRLRPGAHVYIECEAALGEPALPAGYELLRSKRAGEVGYHLAQWNQDPAVTQ